MKGIYVYVDKGLGESDGLFWFIGFFVVWVLRSIRFRIFIVLDKIGWLVIINEEMFIKLK